MKIALAAVTVAAYFAGAATQTTPLKTLAAANGKYFGCAITLSESQNTSLAGLTTSECSLTTPGNEMKWDATEPQQNVFTFTSGNAIVTFAQTNGLSIRGHNLVWHSQLPSWVTNGAWTNATLQAAMVNHITNVVSNYKGRVVHWDVVNEPFNDDGTYRQNLFYTNIGPGYIAIALQAARAADPNAKLFLNDYNLDYPGPKLNAMVSLVKSLKAQGVPIDGIGSESHLIVGQVGSYAQALTTLATAGVSVAVTELDIRTATPETAAASAQQQADYRTVVAACVATATCLGVETWGISDASSWIPSTFAGYGAALPYDANFKPKSAVAGIVAGFGASVAETSSSTFAVAANTAQTSAAIGPATKTQTSTSVKKTSSILSTMAVVINDAVTTQTSSQACSAKYFQCGGKTYRGPTCCTASTCTYQNPYYSQCL
ncbi:hypothetical protein HDU83_007953 [Entophlyctis luteolus]|nr:hypothetical protein HDU83_007953 [Entophlyctis luteolus]